MDVLTPAELVIWLRAQVDLDEQDKASSRDGREVDFKRGMLRMCEAYLEVEDDPGYFVALEMLDLILALYDDRPGHPGLSALILHRGVPDLWSDRL